MSSDIRLAKMHQIGFPTP